MDAKGEAMAYRVTLRLKRGDVVHVNGFPFEYLGDGEIGGNTPPGDCSCAEQNRNEPDFRQRVACSRCAGTPEAGQA